MLIILLILVAAVAALLAWASTRPDTFRIERAIHIDAPIVQVAEQIDDFRKWASWSPWEQLDPTMTRTFSGAGAGVGAIYEWDSKGKAGAGRMESHSRPSLECDQQPLAEQTTHPWGGVGS